jgi:hypothetical protein
VSESVSADILAYLGAWRRASGTPAERGDVIREYADGASECRIVYSRLEPGEADGIIHRELALARERGYALEWKLYGDDTPGDLAGRLLAAGFEAGDTEQVLALPVSEAALAAFGTSGYDVRRVCDEAGLADYAEIAREIGRKNPEEERRQVAAAMRQAPEAMSVHIAYVGGEPVACGRVYFPADGRCAELAGGRTKTTRRRRGLFTAVVASRLAEACQRGRELVFTDALPTSEPILAKRGFRTVTWTRPFLYDPAITRPRL